MTAWRRFFLATLALSLVVVVAALFIGFDIYRTQQALAKDHAQTLLLTQRLRFRIERQVAIERAYLLTGSPELREQLPLDPVIGRILGALGPRMTGGEERSLFARIEARLALLDEDLSDLRSRDPGPAQRRDLFDKVLRPRRIALAGLVERLADLEMRSFEEEIEAASASGRRHLASGGALAVGLLLLLLAIGKFTRSTLLQIGASRSQLERDKAALEDLVAARTERLQQAVSHLQAFAYSVAHDLRAPARTVTAYSELALGRGAQESEDLRGDLRRIRAAGARLRAMLDGLLSLGRLSACPLAVSPVDLSSLAEAIGGELQAQHPDRGARVRVAQGLKAAADPELVRVLLYSLMENAWKFTQARPETSIEVGQTARGQSPVYFVRDDGPGFPAGQARQLFRPFHRLENAEGLPGIGIGLAAAARVVEAHGGRIWAEAEAGRGAAFYFTLEPGP